jgi:ribosomal protein S12 methylthiotransferase accessory factor
MRISSDRKAKVTQISGTGVLTEVPSALQDTPYNKGFLDALLLLEEVKRGHGWQAKIKRIPRLPDEPHLRSYVFTDPEISSGGYDLLDETLAFRRAVSEFVERKAWYHDAPKSVTQVKVGGLRASGFPVDRIAGFSTEERARIPGLSYDEETSLEAVRIPSLSGNGSVLCPTQLLTSRKKESLVTEPLLQEMTSNGLATSWESLEDAVLRGLLELIERDAFMISYSNRLSPPRMKLDSIPRNDDAYSRALEEIQRLNLDLTLLSLPTDFPVFVCLALVRDPSGNGPALTVGARASFSPRKAAEAATVEALVGRAGIRATDAPQHPTKEAHEVQTISERIMLWADSKQLHHLEFFFTGPVTPFPSEPTNTSSRNQLEFLRKSLKKKGYWAGYYRYPLQVSRKFPINIVRVVVPELQPIHLGTISPEVAGVRMKEVPRLLGYTPAKELNTFPHPFP